MWRAVSTARGPSIVVRTASKVSMEEGREPGKFRQTPMGRMMPDGVSLLTTERGSGWRYHNEAASHGCNEEDQDDSKERYGNADERAGNLDFGAGQVDGEEQNE